ncbi:hypothetical protein BOTBODRAFT_534038 [Botryobasidium botryosum FD-172 SS1]|uniref:Uncharacterized protein n=1 Tax=Botryobasidium botryosum (strain FD-172 SS1) TaxID=930990 RepID=A0A067M0V0_BOTB1|nr:hypothetical protein BOTBODRAFT_534038 [Botryobasidium botryosum FD-172 SS1]
MSFWTKSWSGTFGWMTPHSLATGWHTANSAQLTGMMLTWINATSERPRLRLSSFVVGRSPSTRFSSSLSAPSVSCILPSRSL